MHPNYLRGRIHRGTRLLWVTALLAVCASGTAIAAAPRSTPHLAGKWSGKYTGAFSGTFTLRWTQSKSKLHGTIALSKPRGTYGISGSVNGSAIKFGAVDVGATYTGSVAGKSMSGTYRTPQGGGTWSAHKTS
jgi:hypothetical protein